MDQGSNVYQARYYLFLELNIRGTWWADVCHRRHNNALNAWRRSGIQYVKSECCVAMNMAAAPYGTAAFHGQTKEALLEYVTNHTWRDQLYQWLYPLIIFDWCEGCVEDEHMEQSFMEDFFDEMLTTHSVRCMGCYAKENRWFQTPRRAARFARFWSLELLVLMRIAVLEGWWKTADEVHILVGSLPTPALRAALGAAGEGGADDGDVAGDGRPGHRGRAGGDEQEAAPEAPRAVATSDQESKRLARKHRNGLMLKAKILANRVTKSLMVGVCKALQETMLQHGLTLQAMADPERVQAWYVDAATMVWCEHLVKYWAWYSCRDTLVHMGVLHHKEGCLRTGFLEVSDANKVCASIMRYTQELVASDLSWLRSYCELPPGLLLGLLSPDGEVVEAVLKRLKKVTVAMLRLEAGSLEDHGYERSRIGCCTPG
jgi:hypothetical protein